MSGAGNTVMHEQCMLSSALTLEPLYSWQVGRNLPLLITGLRARLFPNTADSGTTWV